MTKAKLFILILFTSILLFVIPNISNAAVSVTRNIYSDDLSMRFSFTGLTLDTSHEYQYGLTKNSDTEVEEWYLLKNFTGSTAEVDIMTTEDAILDVINVVDTGYITIKDITADTIVLEDYAVNLSIPFLRVTNYAVINNGTYTSNDNIMKVPLRSPANSEAYYQYEKITDKNIIDKYNEIKEKNGDFYELQDILKKDVPSSNWQTWDYFNWGYGGGMGWIQSPIEAPDTGLYYLWVYFQGKGVKDLYGYALVDNLQPEIALESITLRDTLTIELGKTYTLSPNFNPSNATNKIVTWSSSDESVATIDNAGRITPIKVGSTIITVTSEDGSKSDTCTVTVTEATNNNSNNNNNDDDNNNSSGGTNNNGSSGNGQDTTVSPQNLPKTGLKLGIVLAIIITSGVVLFTYRKYNKLKDIK